MSQQDFMEKDTVIVLDDKDNCTGSESKRAAHEFLPSQPRGVLHRAFSVFIFDESTGELLLQQRASSKITFPSVWTNTCCSHPLHGMDPPEVDGPDDVADGSVMGTKHAAVRKLDHELGIPAHQVPLEKFKFLTRLHYWAADTVTHGPKSPWGEHEIDYVLFFTVPSKDLLTIKGHPDEVDDVKWVTQTQLVSMMEDTSLLFSPWFRLIVNKWALSSNGWWSQLKETMETDVHCDFKTIHCFDPPKEHMGGGGDAGPLYLEGHKEVVSVGDTTKKQGGYGKLKIHKESKLSQFSHIDEVWSAITLLYLKPLKSNLDSQYVKQTYNASDLQFCDEILCKVSRSFASVIRQLPPSLLVDVLIFYLVLRALDTIEDDMTAFDSNKTKIQHLASFEATALTDPNWTMDGVGEADEKRLLQEFNKCHSVYADLKPESRKVISDITSRMAAGMSEYVGKDLGQGTTDIAEYNRYCHFVAGLVGEGLSRLFAVSGLEAASMTQMVHLSDQMGLFLQKTNIIRDYLEDYVDGRAFWPQSVWKKHSATGDLGYFANVKDDENTKVKALHCVNELVTDALLLAPDCLAYLSKLQCSEVFRFCAIPQVMAIATLDKLYHNPDVFTGVVKIRKGLSCKLINDTNDITGVHATFYKFALSISEKAHKAKKEGHVDPSYDQTIARCGDIFNLTTRDYVTRKKANRLNVLLVLGAGAGLAFGNKLLVRGTLGLLSITIFSRMAGLVNKTALKPSHTLLKDASCLEDRSVKPPKKSN